MLRLAGSAAAQICIAHRSDAALAGSYLWLRQAHARTGIISLAHSTMPVRACTSGYGGSRRQLATHWSTSLCQNFDKLARVPQTSFKLRVHAVGTRAFSAASNVLYPTSGASHDPRTDAHGGGDVRELHAVNVALIANSLIFIAKMVAWGACGGSALLAEAIHSLADIGNQFLLRLGIIKAQKAPTPEYPYGYMKDKYVFSLISAVGIFCLGAGASILNGIQAIIEPAVHTDAMGWGLAVLMISTLVEGYSLSVAVRAVTSGASAAGMSFLEYIRAGRDPTSIAIMMEDGAAVAGLLVAALATKLVTWTGYMYWDGVGSVLVGFLLGGVAIFLIQRNRSLLIGRSMAEEDLAGVMMLLNRDPVIKSIYDAKSEEIGPGVYRFKAEIDFNGTEMINRYMSRKDMTLLRSKFAEAQGDERDLDHLLKHYGAEIISLVGAEVDRIEADIQRSVPGIRYVDLETDRGRFSGYKSMPLAVREPSLTNNPVRDLSEHRLGDTDDSRDDNGASTQTKPFVW